MAFVSIKAARTVDLHTNLHSFPKAKSTCMAPQVAKPYR